jgi:hypothetical protein
MKTKLSGKIRLGQQLEVDVEWSIGSTHDSGARGPGFDPTPKPRTAFLETLISLLSDNGLKNY